MNWLTEPFRHEFMQRALFGCALIGFTNGVLSAFIVLRRLALMADAMAHSLLPGVAVALILFGLAPATYFSARSSPRCLSASAFKSFPAARASKRTLRSACSLPARSRSVWFC